MKHLITTLEKNIQTNSVVDSELLGKTLFQYIEKSHYANKDFSLLIDNEIIINPVGKKIEDYIDKIKIDSNNTSEYLHTTVGIYSDGSFKLNCVPSKDIVAHIQYNLKMRFGRALILDSFPIYRGYFSLPELNSRLKDIEIINIKLDKPSKQYQ
jgi:hypothetical protein